MIENYLFVRCFLIFYYVADLSDDTSFTAILMCMIPSLCLFYGVSNVSSRVILVAPPPDVADLSADTSFTVLLLCIIPLLCLFYDGTVFLWSNPFGRGLLL